MAQKRNHSRPSINIGEPLTRAWLDIYPDRLNPGDLVPDFGAVTAVQVSLDEVIVTFQSGKAQVYAPTDILHAFTEKFS